MPVRGSPHTVTYKDLVALVEGFEREAARTLQGARTKGIPNLNALTHHHETTKTLVRMLKKGLPAKQTDMLSLFEQVK